MFCNAARVRIPGKRSGMSEPDQRSVFPSRTFSGRPACCWRWCRRCNWLATPVKATICRVASPYDPASLFTCQSWSGRMILNTMTRSRSLVPVLSVAVISLAACGGSGAVANGPTYSCVVQGTGGSLCSQVSGNLTSAQVAQITTLCQSGLSGTTSSSACPSTNGGNPLVGTCSAVAPSQLDPSLSTLPADATFSVLFYAPMDSSSAQNACAGMSGSWGAGASASASGGATSGTAVPSVSCGGTALSCGLFFCCPPDHPYECGGSCYSTTASATAQCSQYYWTCQ